MVDFESINAAALGCYEDLLRQWLPAGVKRGNEYVVGDLSGAKGESCSINIRKGAWSDFSTGEKGGDPVSLYARINNLSQVDAAKELAAKLGLSDVTNVTTPPPNGKHHQPDPEIIWPVPPSAPPYLNHHARLGVPDQTYAYTDSEGLLIGYVCRFNLPHGKKEVLPQVFTTKGWAWKSLPKPRPLYNMGQLDAHPERPIMVVEGEGCADAAQKIFPSYIVVTWPGGGKAVHLADWRYIYGRRVVIWPDRDRHVDPKTKQELPYEEQPGTVAATAIAEILKSHCPVVQMLDVTALPNDGDDIKDRIAAGWDRAQIISWAKDNVYIYGQPKAKIIKKPKGGSVDKNAPFDIASTILASEFVQPDGPVKHYSGQWYKWTGTHYPPVEDALVRNKIWEWLNASTVTAKDGGQIPLKPKSALVNNVIDALTAQSFLGADTTAPQFLDGRQLQANQCLSMRNGILELRTGILHAHTEKFWSHNCVPYDYMPNAPPPTFFMMVLNDQWANDQQSIDTLQEIFGYCLTTDTSFQKMFMLVGPPRAGKGVISAALAGMIGHENVVTPTFSALQTEFGVAPMIGKMVAIVPDARLEGSPSSLIERLLNISGEDHMTINRKNKPHWNGKLSVRFFISTNMLPRFGDASGAIASRFIVLSMKRSHLGKEMIDLKARIINELPGILNWSREGLLRLYARGHFVMPASSKDKIDEFMELAAPINAFIRDTCVITPTAKTDCRVMFHLWTKWCRDNGRDGHGTLQTFSRDLKAQQPDITTERAKSWSDGSAMFVGIEPVPGALEALRKSQNQGQSHWGIDPRDRYD